MGEGKGGIIISPRPSRMEGRVEAPWAPPAYLVVPTLQHKFPKPKEGKKLNRLMTDRSTPLWGRRGPSGRTSSPFQQKPTAATS